MPHTEETLDGFEGPLVSAARLQRELSNQQVRVLDIRGRHPSSALPHAKSVEYERGHVPGAVFVDWEHDFVDLDDPIPVQLADARAFSEQAGLLGVGDGDVVVAYDDYYGIFAARLAWAFRVNGGHACVLDGGWQTWVEEGRPTSDQATAPPRRRFTGALRPRLRRTLTEVLDARSQGASLVDARPRHLFVGDAGSPGTGHIPGAHCLPYQELVDGATGLWASPEATARLARDAGIDPRHPPRELIATCGSGVSATVALLALERIGVHTDGVYDGSFNEWSADGSRPVEYGATTFAPEADTPNRRDSSGSRHR